jgi:hypothetical protein
MMVTVPAMPLNANSSSRRSNWARSYNGDSSRDTRDSNRSRSSPVLHIYQCQRAIPKESKRAILWPLGTKQEFSHTIYDPFKETKHTPCLFVLVPIFPRALSTGSNSKIGQKTIRTIAIRNRTTHNAMKTKRNPANVRRREAFLKEQRRLKARTDQWDMPNILPLLPACLTLWNQCKPSLWILCDQGTGSTKYLPPPLHADHR